MNLIIFSSRLFRDTRHFLTIPFPKRFQNVDGISRATARFHATTSCKTRGSWTTGKSWRTRGDLPGLTQFLLLGKEENEEEEEGGLRDPIRILRNADVTRLVVVVIIVIVVESRGRPDVSDPYTTLKFGGPGDGGGRGVIFK